MASRMMSARYGHIKRKLSNEEPLHGGSLALALEVLDEYILKKPGEPLLFVIKDKIKTGTPLNDYEYHIFVEVILLHKKLEG